MSVGVLDLSEGIPPYGPQTTTKSEQGRPLTYLPSACQKRHRNAGDGRSGIRLSLALLRLRLCFDGRSVSRKAICLLIEAWRSMVIALPSFCALPL